MSHVLYRKYRSQIFDDLVGQEHVATILKNAVAQGQISHAYLFYGPRGLGKTSTARILAKAVNCPQLQQDGNPCDECESCVAVREGKFLDLIEIDAASNRGIDQIRELKERIEFSPSEGKKKVYIIDEVHMMTTEAFNALLKTLEEPPEHAIFILATTEIHKVPATIMSRCQRFDFRLGSDADVKSLIDRITKEEGITVDDGAMDLLIDNARGSYRDALSLLDVVVSGQEDQKDPKHIAAEEVRAVLGLADSTMAYFFLEKIINAQSSEALDLVQELAQKGVNLGQFVKFVLSVLREILVGELKDKVDTVEYSFAEKLDRKTTLRLINLFVEAERGLKDALVPTLPLELLVADAMDIFPGKEGESKGKLQTGKGSDSSGSGGLSTSKKGVKKSSSSRKNSTGRSVKYSVRKGSNKVKADTKASKEVSEEKIAGITLGKSELEKQWGEVLKELRPFNSHLYAFIGRSQVLELRNGLLKVAVAFDFHKDRIESPKSRDAIAKVFKKVFGERVKLECVIDDSIRKSVKAAPDVVILEEKEPATVNVEAKSGNVYDSVAEVFGDELVSI